MRLVTWLLSHRLRALVRLSQIIIRTALFAAILVDVHSLHYDLFANTLC